jgi:hypothetical protein
MVIDPATMVAREKLEKECAPDVEREAGGGAHR